MDDVLHRRDEDGLCTLTLNRPDKLNALDGAILGRLAEEVAALETQTESIGCVILRGAGRSFCAGLDLGAVGDGFAPRVGHPQTIERLARLPQPVIAALHGVCMTGGLELALAADFLVAERTVRMADTHGKWGLVGGWGMSQRLPRRVGAARAKRIIMTGQPEPMEKALAIGLIDVLADEGEAYAEAVRLARSILANSWFTSRAVKRLIADTEGLPLAQGLAHEQYHHPGRAPDSAERIAAFSGKPKP
jgi:enoyl-CoA hydratase